MQGNTGTGANWLRPSLAGELFKAGQPLDARRYFIIIPDGLGRGGSNKPSDGLKGNFPHYRYHDMVDSAHQMVTEGLKVAHLRLVIGNSRGHSGSGLRAVSAIGLFAALRPARLQESALRRPQSSDAGS